MRSNTAILYLAIAVAAAPSLAIPVSVGEAKARSRELDARLSLGSVAGIAGEDLLKEFTQGAALGGGLDILGDLINKKSPTPQQRDLDARFSLSGVLKLVKDLFRNGKRSAPEPREPLNLGVIEKALLGTGISLGASALVQPVVDKIEKAFRRELEFSLAAREDVALEARGSVTGTVVEDGLKEIIGKNVVNGIGSTIGATALGGLFEHFFDGSSNKASRDLSRDTLLQLLKNAELSLRDVDQLD